MKVSDINKECLIIYIESIKSTTKMRCKVNKHFTRENHKVYIKI